MDEITSGQVRFLNPFMSFTNKKVLSRRLEEIFKEEFDIPASEVHAAADAAWQELSNTREEMKKKGEEVIALLKEDRQTRYRPRRTSLPCGPGDQPRYPGTDQLLRSCSADRGFRLRIWQKWNVRLSLWISGCTTPDSTPLPTM